jgi:hypothetical protein
MLPGERKSVEPMAARVHPQDVGSAHQSMHHLVADSDWSDTALLAAVAAQVVPVLSGHGQAPCFWIIDDTSYRKWGKHSVGVARHIAGTWADGELPGRGDLTLATEEGVCRSITGNLPRVDRDKKRCRPPACEIDALPPRGDRLGADRAALAAGFAWHGAGMRLR